MREALQAQFQNGDIRAYTALISPSLEPTTSWRTWSCVGLINFTTRLVQRLDSTMILTASSDYLRCFMIPETLSFQSEWRVLPSQHCNRLSDVGFITLALLGDAKFRGV